MNRIVAACAIAFTICLALALRFFSIPAIDLFSPEITVLNEWHPRVNALYNAFYSWKINSLVLLIGRQLELILPNREAALAVSAVFIFFGGTASFLGRTAKASPLFCCLTAAILSISYAMLFLFDGAILFSICFFPWFLLAGREVIAKTGVWQTAFFIVAFYCLQTSANQLAVIYVCIAWLLLAFGSGKKQFRFFLAAALISIIYSAAAPKPLPPAYPSLAHVVPDDNVSGHIMPLVGPAPIIPYIHREIVKEVFFYPALLLLAGAGAALLTGAKSRVLYLLLFFSLAAAGDSVFRESFSSILPAAAVNRLIPGLFFFPLLPHLVALALFTAGCCAFLERRFRFLLLLIPVAAAINFINPRTANLIIFTADGISSARVRPVTDPKLISPSYNVYISAPHLIPLAAYRALESAPAESVSADFAEGSHGSSAAFASLFDNNPKTRWSPGNGRQSGDEWLRIAFTASHNLKGIILSPGVYATDFPRAFEVRYAPACRKVNGKIEGEFSMIARFDKWEGTVDYTADGYPYFGSQAEIKLLFDRPLDVQCLEIRQTGRESRFDWSIAELQVIR